jgi:hypothetical protein
MWMNLMQRAMLCSWEQAQAQPQALFPKDQTAFCEQL